MGVVAPFRRRLKTNVKVSRRKRWRAPNGIWLLTLAFVGIAVAENFKFETAGSNIALPSVSLIDKHQTTDRRAAKFGRCFNSGQPTCVIDGDTIRYQGVRVRFSDIDTPETRAPKCASEAVLAEKATQRVIELINAGSFSLENPDGRDEDRYGRKLRIVKINGRSVGDTLIAEGLARRWDGARRSWCG